MKEGMKMPGFTAETSLYKPKRQYNLGVNRGVDGQVVIPQLDYPYCDGPLEPGECCYRFIHHGYVKLVCHVD
ncbi:MAG: hypothetical protein KAJ93_06345 [Methanosarcinales archaeon]|nr:hypothetical protein [Methanosarcinales archaeon]